MLCRGKRDALLPIPEQNASELSDESQSSLITLGPLPAVFSYTPLDALRYWVKPCFSRLLGSSEVSLDVIFGADMTLRTAALHFGQTVNAGSLSF